MPVVMTTNSGNEELAVQALRAGAATYLPQRNLARDLLEVLSEILSVTESRKKRELFLGRMTSVEHRFVLENDQDLVPEVVSHVEELLRQMRLFDESEQMRVGIAVHEAVVNAMVHGNLEVGSELKGGDWKAYHDLVAARAIDPRFRHRRVHIVVRAARGPFLEVRVRDEGPGYDPSRLPDPTDPANQGQSSGRGLLMIRTFFDRVSLNAAGNEISMTKGVEGSA
jgi:anti-sigma regulatory factor (Ser/Thr protein kinase)